MNPKELIRVFLVDDHPMMVLGLREFLTLSGRVEVVGTAAGAEEAVEKIRNVTPDVVVLDIGLPGMSGFAAATVIRGMDESIGIVFLSMHDEEEFIQEFMQSSADAYVLKNNPPEELLEAIEKAHRDEFFISPSLSSKVIREHRKYTPRRIGLTEREIEVLVLVAQGLSSKQIAEKICVSSRTVGKFREGIMQKLDLHTVAALTNYAIQKKLVSAPRG